MFTSHCIPNHFYVPTLQKDVLVITLDAIFPANCYEIKANIHVGLFRISRNLFLDQPPHLGLIDFLFFHSLYVVAR